MRRYEAFGGCESVFGQIQGGFQGPRFCVGVELMVVFMTRPTRLVTAVYIIHPSVAQSHRHRVDLGDVEKSGEREMEVKQHEGATVGLVQKLFGAAVFEGGKAGDQLI